LGNTRRIPTEGLGENNKIKVERDQLNYQITQLQVTFNQNLQEKSMLETNLRQEIENLRNDIETHKFQIQVFQTDFTAEREARERQVHELNEVKEERNKIREMYDRMKLEEKRNEQQNFANMRNKHASPVGSAYGNYQSMNPVGSGVHHPHQPQRGFQQQQQRGGFQQHPQQQQQHYQQPYQQQQHHQQPQQNFDTGNANQATEVAHRSCPKCNQKFPDIETLEIHLMDCLDD